METSAPAMAGSARRARSMRPVIAASERASGAGIATRSGAAAGAAGAGGERAAGFDAASSAALAAAEACGSGRPQAARRQTVAIRKQRAVLMVPPCIQCHGANGARRRLDTVARSERIAARDRDTWHDHLSRALRG